MRRIVKPCSAVLLMAAFMILIMVPPAPSYSEELRRAQTIPVMGVSLEGQERIGTIVHLILSFEKRTDRTGLIVHFNDYPGRFSQMAQLSVRQAIERAAHTFHINTDSWSVILTVPYEGVAIYGESLSAMVALSALAMASGQTIIPGIVLTGTIKEDGHIGPVGSVSLKLHAAKHASLNQVLIPVQKDGGDKAHHMTYSTSISSVHTVHDAFNALTYPDQTKPQPTIH